MSNFLMRNKLIIAFIDEHAIIWHKRHAMSPYPTGSIILQQIFQIEYLIHRNSIRFYMHARLVSSSDK